MFSSFRDLIRSLVLSFSGDLVVLGTRTLCKGGVMIRWLGYLGCCVGTSYHASFWSVCAVCSSCVLGHLIVNNAVHLHFPLYYHDVVVVMSCNFHSCLLYVSHARIDPVGSHAPHHALLPINRTNSLSALHSKAHQ